MFSIVVITHGELAKELISAVNFILPQKPRVKMTAVSIDASKDSKDFEKKVRASIDTVDEGDGILLVTDMFGGTPSNISLMFLESGEMEVISGVNLPMLLKLGTVKEETTLKEAVELAAKAGRDNIIVASELLNKNG